MSLCMMMNTGEYLKTKKSSGDTINANIQCKKIHKKIHNTHVCLRYY